MLTGGEAPLSSPIKRVFYLAKEATDREHEVQLPANAAALAALSRVGAVVYGVGSLYTSIAPSLVLQGVGESIASRAVPKIFMLNGTHDRETSACLRHDGPMSAVRISLAPLVLADTLCHACFRASMPTGSSCNADAAFAILGSAVHKRLCFQCLPSCLASQSFRMCR